MGAIKDLQMRCEEAAQAFLGRKGYAILERGWESEGEGVDFVLRDEEGTLVFLDVLSRSDGASGFPDEPKPKPSREKFERVALAYLEGRRTPECEVRFDLLSFAILGRDRSLVRHHLGACSAG